jgi:hypothetical protein
MAGTGGDYLTKKRGQLGDQADYILIIRCPDNQDSPLKVKVPLNRLFQVAGGVNIMGPIDHHQGVTAQNLKPARPAHLSQALSYAFPGNIKAPLGQNLQRRHRRGRIGQLVLTEKGQGEFIAIPSALHPKPLPV